MSEDRHTLEVYDEEFRLEQMEINRRIAVARMKTDIANKRMAVTLALFIAGLVVVAIVAHVMEGAGQ